LFGVPVTNALTLSLVKRIPDLALGLPGLFVWYLLEMRRLVSRRAPRPRGTTPRIDST
jgi:glycosyltransferase 2 family protein